MIKLTKHTRFAALLLCAAATLMLAACSGPGTGREQGRGNTYYGNAEDVETVNSAWGSTDIQMTAERMAQSMLADPVISEAAAAPKIRLREVRNLTSEHIDTKGITDMFRVQMMRSRKVRFLADNTNMGEVMEEREFTESMTRRAENKLMSDTDYILTGTVRSIRKQDADRADVYYQITMELVDPQSGEILWTEQNQIRKSTDNRRIGW
ncbi:penicillin-binding protein activator LpoB [Desulfovibrio sp. OttesenSCG-928-C06]|nr:penicillin-binding protein activator LpoB [Desulfovibrio sp. OttesenSCG-928-C06]